MCRSFSISLLTGIFTYSVAAYLWHRDHQDDRPIAQILLVFGAIQWLEAILWYALQTNNTWLNLAATSLIPLVLSLELVNSLAVARYYRQITNSEKLVYLLAGVGLMVSWFWYPGLTDISPVTGSLRWASHDIQWSSRWLFLALLVYPLLDLLRISPQLTIMFIGTVVTFIWALAYGDTFGSNWCWLANVLSIFQLIVN